MTMDHIGGSNLSSTENRSSKHPSSPRQSFRPISELPPAVKLGETYGIADLQSVEFRLALDTALQVAQTAQLFAILCINIHTSLIVLTSTFQALLT